MFPQKISIGITGGIGSGKSFVCRFLKERGIPVFYCDPEARVEIQINPDIRAELSALVGSSVYLPTGSLNKPLMRDFMMQNPQHVLQVNSIVHPRVRQRLQAWIEASKDGVVATECALLFEAGFDAAVTYSVVVDAPEQVRLQRVMQRDSVDEATARKWMSWQLSEAEKCRRADFVLENDGQSDLSGQIEKMLSLFTSERQ